MRFSTAKHLLFASTLLLPTMSFPTTTLTRRGVHEPKIGYELECRQIMWTNPTAGPADNAAQTKATKGTPFTFPDLPAKPDWKFTAEIMASNLHRLTSEIVVDGGEKTAKHGVPLLPGENVGRRVGGEVYEFVSTLAGNWEKGGEYRQARILKPELGLQEYAWDLELQGGALLKPEQLTWGLQVTAPFPLEALLDIVPEPDTDKPKTLLVDQAKFNIVPACVFPYRGVGENYAPWSKADIGDDVRGYVSLLMAYIKTSKSGSAKAGPKHSTSIMPRTDFKAMYYQLVKPKIEQIVAEVSNPEGWWNSAAGGQRYYKDTTITDFSSWIYALCRSMGVCDSYDSFTGDGAMIIPWDGGDKVDGNGKKVPTVIGPTVGEWLESIVSAEGGIDAVSQFDLGRHGQIGGLKDTFEFSVEGRKQLPIFEFRDLAGKTTEKLADWLGEIEDELRRHHKKYSQAVKPPADASALAELGCIKLGSN